MSWVERGVVGVVTNGNTRDIDEIRLEKVPLYYRGHGSGIRPGRSVLESVNRPVNIGGVQVRPGDVVVADGDGVIVVPRKVAIPVALYAHGVHKGDKAGRRKLYKKLGIPIDKTVEGN
jgi:regulator of RNase E activity RraA